MDLAEGGGINLGEMKATDFSNPMFDAIGGGELTNGGGKKVDGNGTSNPLHDAGELFEAGAGGKGTASAAHPLEEGLGSGYSKFNSSSAILAPSSVIHKSSPAMTLRQTALNPNSAETDKDTAALVEEDKSEC